MSRPAPETITAAIRDVYGVGEGDIPLHAPVFGGREKAYLAETIDSTFVSYVGAYVTRFERMLEEITGAAHAIAMVNGTTALQIALVLAGVKPGDLVITQALNFVASANAAGTPEPRSPSSMSSAIRSACAAGACGLPRDAMRAPRRFSLAQGDGAAGRSLRADAQLRHALQPRRHHDGVRGLGASLWWRTPQRRSAASIRAFVRHLRRRGGAELQRQQDREDRGRRRDTDQRSRDRATGQAPDDHRQDAAPLALPPMMRSATISACPTSMRQSAARN